MSLLTERYAAWLKMTPLERVIDRAVDAYIRFHFVDGSPGGVQQTRTAKEIEWQKLHLLIKILENDFKWQARSDVDAVSAHVIEMALHERAVARQAENEAAT